jgi:preprotein translocase subunit SecG
MFILIVVVILIVALLLSLVVLVQNPKGGGLASTFSSNNQFMGVRKTTDFLEKSTWSFAVALLFLSILSVAFIPNKGTEGVDVDQEMMEKVQEIPDAIPENTIPAEQASETPAETPDEAPAN